MPDKLEILPIRGIGDIEPGADLPAIIAAAAPWLRDGDVLVVTSKIVSKAEGQLVDVPIAGPEREAAREEILMTETARPVARRGHTRIVQTHHGFVMASAGIDASNVERSRLVLLPKDPDASARSLRAAFRERFAVDVAVIISDTMGRPWRNGLTDVALGAAGIDPVRDHRGETDPYGNELHITQMAVIDELCAAAELVKGKRDQVPVAVIRGHAAEESWVRPEDGPGATALVRDAANDLFSLGTAEARAAGLRDASTLDDAPAFGGADQRGHSGRADQRSHSGGAGPVDRRVVESAAGSWSLVPLDAGLPPGTAYAIACPTPPDGPVALGMAVHRLRCALAAEGLATIWLPDRALLAVGPP